MNRTLQGVLGAAVGEAVGMMSMHHWQAGSALMLISMLMLA